MKTFQAMCGILVLSMWAATVGQAQGFRYMGPTPGAPTGEIEVGPGQLRTVAVGDEIPGWGRVKQITDLHLVVEQQVSEAEQERLRIEGKAVYEVIELHIPRASLRSHPLPSLR